MWSIHYLSCCHDKIPGESYSKGCDQGSVRSTHCCYRQPEFNSKQSQSTVVPLPDLKSSTRPSGNLHSCVHMNAHAHTHTHICIHICTLTPFKKLLKEDHFLWLTVCKYSLLWRSHGGQSMTQLAIMVTLYPPYIFFVRKPREKSAGGQLTFSFLRAPRPWNKTTDICGESCHVSEVRFFLADMLRICLLGVLHLVMQLQ